MIAPHDAQIVTYCHCSDCKRWTGAAAPVFAAFSASAVTIGGRARQRSFASGVTRWNCNDCGSPLGATFPDLPDQVYVPLGLLPNAEHMPPSLECHAQGRLTWLDQDVATVAPASGRDALRQAQ